jgi:methionyl aminopeptidase
MIRYKSTDEVRTIRRAAKIVHDALLKVEEHVQPGVTLKELDTIAGDYILSQDAIPGFKGLYDFPATLCLSRLRTGTCTPTFRYTLQPD